METMHWDLSVWATRDFLIDEVCSFADGIQDDICERAAQAGVPDEHHHHLSDVLATIDGLQGVSEAVREHMRAIYQVLAEAEAQVHGCAVDQTHFHEVGNGSHIESVLAICLAVEELNPARITATPVQVGCGTIECAHGVLDIPAPATQAILERGVSVAQRRLEGERCTPTSAAVIYHFVNEYFD